MYTKSKFNYTSPEALNFKIFILVIWFLGILAWYWMLIILFYLWRANFVWKKKGFLWLSYFFFGRVRSSFNWIKKRNLKKLFLLCTLICLFIYTRVFSSSNFKTNWHKCFKFCMRHCSNLCVTVIIYQVTIQCGHQGSPSTSRTTFLKEHLSDN